MSDWETTEGDRWAANADRYRRMLAGYGEVLVDAVRCKPGERVIDVGCGCGDVSLAAAEAVGSTGRVTGIDLSPAMLDVARTRALAAELDNIELVQADAARWQPSGDRADVLVSRFGVMFFDDPVSAFTNLRRAMRGGGRLVFVCWQDFVANEWMVVPFTAISEVLPMPTGTDPTAPGPFALADGDRVREILAAAGFSSVGIEPVARSLWIGADVNDAVEFMRTTTLGRAMFESASEARATEAARRAATALEPYATSAGVELGGAAWLVSATA